MVMSLLLQANLFLPSCFSLSSCVLCSSAVALLTWPVTTLIASSSITNEICSADKPMKEAGDFVKISTWRDLV